MDSKKVVKEFWASYGRGNLDDTWDAYVADDIVVHAPTWARGGPRELAGGREGIVCCVRGHRREGA